MENYYKVNFVSPGETLKKASGFIIFPPSPSLSPSRTRMGSPFIASSPIGIAFHRIVCDRHLLIRTVSRAHDKGEPNERKVFPLCESVLWNWMRSAKRFPAPIPSRIAPTA